MERRHRRDRARRAFAFACPLRRLAAGAGARHARRVRRHAVRPGHPHRPRARDQRTPQDRGLRRGRRRPFRAPRRWALRSRSAPTGTGTCSRRSTAPGLADAVDITVSSAWVGAAQAAPAHLPAHGRPARCRAARTRSSSATPGAATSTARGRRACAPSTCADRTSVTTAPRRPTTTSRTTCIGRRTCASSSICSQTTPSVDGAFAAFPVRGAQVALEHLHRPRQRERLGADLHRLRHLVARRSTPGSARRSRSSVTSWLSRSTMIA